MKRQWCLISAVIALSVAAPAAAQAPADDATKAAARSLAETGKKRFESGDYSGAIEALRDAEKYFRAPTITRMRALAHEKLGQLLEAQAVHKQVADEPLAAGVPPEFEAAREESKKSLTSLDARIPRVQIAVLHAPAGTRVTLDGKALDAAALAQPMRMNPGKYLVAVEPPGAAKITREVILAEQANEKVVIDLAPPPPPKPVVTAPAATTTTTASAAPAAPGGPAGGNPDGGRSMLGPAIAFGVGGVGLVAGAITGGLSFAVAGDVKKKCGEELICSPDARDQVEQGKAFGYVSTIGFALAGAGAAVGVVLLLVPGKKAEPARVGIALGPTFTGVKGAF